MGKSVPDDSECQITLDKHQACKFSVDSPYKVDPETRVWVRGVYVGCGHGKHVRESGRETGKLGE